MRSCTPRSIISIIGMGSISPPYTPLTETVPPGAHRLDRHVQRVKAVHRRHVGDLLRRAVR